MIDAHCHLEQDDFAQDLDGVISSCRKAGLKALVTSCARPGDLERTLEICSRYRGYVFPTAGIHPEFIKDITHDAVESFIRTLSRTDELVGIGEAGLDYHWIKDAGWREKQADMFRQVISIAKNMPLVVHSRDAGPETIEIMEQEGQKKALMHMFGYRDLLSRVMDNGWHISMNTIVLRSKAHRKIARDVPLDRLLLETDSPWLSPSRILGPGYVNPGGLPDGDRNDPRSIRLTCQKISEARKQDFEEVWEQCGRNAQKLFGL